MMFFAPSPFFHSARALRRLTPLLCVAMLCVAIGALSPALGAAPARAATPAAKQPPPVEAARYRANLQSLETALRATTPRVADLQKVMPRTGLVRRADGKSQRVGHGQLRDALTKARGGRLPKRNAAALKTSVAARIAETERWQNSKYQPADAQNLVAGLVSSNAIRVGPTALQEWFKSVGDAWANLMTKIGSWFSSSAPKAPSAKLPEIDPRWIKFFFYSCVLSLLAIIAFMVWKALGGRIGRNTPRLEDRVLEGEDAELLKLPSDELLERATRFAAQVNYREAVRHRFIATLVRFDERALWRYNTRRTNREHIALLRSDAARTSLAPPLDSLARRFDRVRYGGAQASHSDWLRFDADAAELEALPAARADFATPPTGKAATGKPAKGARA